MKKIRSSGFTIIELLAAMAVLLIMVALLSRVFGSAASTWRAGNKRIESNNTGRSAMEFMSTELSSLLVGSPAPTLFLESDRPAILGMESDAISFISLAHKAEYRVSTGEQYRDVQQVRYAIGPMVGETNRYALYRYVVEKWESSDFSSYTTNAWLAEFDVQEKMLYGSTIAENIRNFEVFITPVGKTEPQDDYSYDVDGPPAAIDIYLGVLAEDDAIRAALTTNDTTFVDAATRRYATRIYVQNRAGYIE